SALEVTEAHLERIEKLNPELLAFLSVSKDGAHAAARQIDLSIRAGKNPGPLAGVPYGCKDLIFTRELPTTAGSRVLASSTPEHDATVVTRITEAGGILLGKTSLPEF